MFYKLKTYKNTSYNLIFFYKKQIAKKHLNRVHFENKKAFIVKHFDINNLF